jgi:type II secretory pathway pseudopilin PulG
MGMKSRKSFTLIEMVIVLGVLGFALPVLFAIIFLIIRQQGRIYSLMQVKKEGDFAYNSIKSTIRLSGRTVVDPAIDTSPYPTYNPCPILPNNTPTPASAIYLNDQSNRQFSYELKNGKIASNSADNNITDEYLTTDGVVISNMQFSCYRTSQFSPPVVWINFTVSKSGSDPDPASMDYTSRFQIKSY